MSLPADSNDLVMMVDAFDIWFQLSPATLIARYQELGTTGVVLGADKACWPNAGDSVSSQCNYNSFVIYFIFTPA